MLNFVTINLTSPTLADDEIAHTESEESEESEDSDDETAPVSDMDTVTSNNDAVDEDLE
eukprot:SAG31_NODE_486_length_15001_cov_8.454405_13_plen_59_part_00